MVFCRKMMKPFSEEKLVSREKRDGAVMNSNHVGHLLTLDKIIDEQSDLQKLCHDRSLETKELFEPNSFYGIDFVIKKYSLIVSNKTLQIIFPHGVNLSNIFVWEAEKKASIPCVYFYSPHRYKIYKKETNKAVLPSASPFIYLAELLKNESVPKREGTIFFPTHSSHHVTAIMDFDKLANELEQLDDKYKPITVCIYWRDFNLGHHKIFQKKGFRIVSAGHMFDKWFLFRFYHLCSTHKYAMSNELGSHLFYSIKAGCSFSLMNYKQAIKQATGSILKRDTSVPDQKIVADLVRLFSVPLEEITDEQLRCVDSYLGIEYLKTPDELRAELEFADNLDKYGFSRHPESKKMYYRVPNLVPRRFLRKIKKILKKSSELFNLTK